jgi:alpha-L-fucosidase
MPRFKSFLFLSILTALPNTMPLSAQVSEDRETDPRVLEKLNWFQDVKFGLMMHWGP